MKFETITPETIRTNMERMALTRAQICEDLNLNQGDFSSYLTGSREIPETRKSQIYWYFAAKEKAHTSDQVEALTQSTLFADYEKIKTLLFEAQSRLQNMRDYGRNWFTTTETASIEVDMEVNHLTQEENNLLAVYEKVDRLLENVYLYPRYSQKHYEHKG